jgi:hypothetical protein
MGVELLPAHGRMDRHGETVNSGNFANAPKMKIVGLTMFFIALDWLSDKIEK